MNRKELNAIVKAYHQQVSNNHAMVLATVVGIEGSAFRGLSAKMLITDEGNFVGAISGGCLEKDTVKKALWVIQHQQPQLITYDTLEDDDLGIGVALGCNGVIDILLEPIHAENELNPIALIETAINTNEAFILATFFTKEQRRWPLAGTKLVKINAACVGKLPPFIATFPENLWQISYQQKEPIIAGLNTKENNCFVLLQFEPPPLQLYLAGAGNDAFAVANLALQMGWQVHIVSQALAYHWQKNETDIQLHNQLPAHFFQTNKLPENACVVLLTHSFPKDLAALQALLPQSFRYLGILGPHKKQQLLFEALTASERSLFQAKQSSIFGPVGLAMQAETVEEIALSVMAEIQMVIKNADGGHLKNTKGSIHQRNTQKNIEISL